MHPYFNGWVVLDWSMGTFLFWLVVALLVVLLGWFFYRAMPFGILAVCYMLYQGIHWPHLWDIVSWFFWAGMLALLIMAFVYLLLGNRWLVGTITYWVSAFVMGLLVLIMAVNIVIGLWNHAFPGHAIGDDSSNAPSGVPTALPSGSETDEPSGTPSGGTTGSTTCRNATWHMTESEPAGTTKVVRQGIHNADTGPQAFQAFYAWHDTMAMDNATIYQQLADAVHADPPSEASLVSSTGYATPAMSQLVCRVTESLDGAHYYPEHSDIRVVLTDDTEFRVMADSGQVQEQ